MNGRTQLDTKKIILRKLLNRQWQLTLAKIAGESLVLMGTMVNVTVRRERKKKERKKEKRKKERKKEKNSSYIAILIS